MKSIQESIEIIAQQGMLPLYFNTDENVSVEVLRALYNAGIRAVEYTNRGSQALVNFKKMVEIKNIEMPEMLLGIGTIKNESQAKDFHNAGADFFISPGFVPEVADFLKSKNSFYAPGCMTPTEIIAAENTGITFIKLFPGNILGPDFMSAIKDVFPSLTFMVTGGVDTTSTSIQNWFSAGVSAVGLGSKLITKKRMEESDYATIENETKKVLDTIQTLRKQS